MSYDSTQDTKNHINKVIAYGENFIKLINGEHTNTEVNEMDLFDAIQLLTKWDNPDTQKAVKKMGQLASILKNTSKLASTKSDFIKKFRAQIAKHDASKLEEPEKSTFDIITPKLKTMAYGSPEYRATLKEMHSTLAVHYKKNSHHPEFYTNGIIGMNLFDVIEMLIDWKAATERQKDGNIHTSLEQQKDRFNIKSELLTILKNTTKSMGW